MVCVVVPAQPWACRRGALYNRAQSQCSLPSCATRRRQMLHSSHLLSGVRCADGSAFPQRRGPLWGWKGNRSSSGSKMLLAASSVAISEDKIPGFYFISLAVVMLTWCCCLSWDGSFKTQGCLTATCAVPTADQSPHVVSGSCLPDVSHCQDPVPRTTLLSSIIFVSVHKDGNSTLENKPATFSQVFLLLASFDRSPALSMNCSVWP